MARSKYQAYETETISRSQIKNAPYNPRFMDDKAKKALQKNIASHGLVAALTWNKRTGNLVGGHQRLEQLDALEKNKDYELTVCVVDVDEREEATLNVQLNNPSMQGEWDLDKLANMAEEFDLNFEKDLGFSKEDIDFMFDGDDRYSEMFESEEKEEMRDSLQQIHEKRKLRKEDMKDKSSIDCFAVIVFPTKKDRDRFYKEISVPSMEKYITEEQVRRLKR